MGEKIKVEKLGCFEQVAKVIGVERAKVELFKVFNMERNTDDWDMKSPSVGMAFDWRETPQGYGYWSDVTHDIIRKKLVANADDD